MKLIDLSSHNIGESIFKDGKVIGTRYHDFDWKKARANGIEGAIIKSSQGLYKDVGFDYFQPFHYANVYEFGSHASSTFRDMEFSMAIQG